MELYGFLLGSHPRVQELIASYHDAKDRLNETGGTRDDVLNVARKILARINEIIISTIKDSSIVDVTRSIAIKGFMMKHARELNALKSVFDLVLADIPSFIVNDDGMIDIDLFSLCDLVESRKTSFNHALRDVIVNAVLDGYIPGWVDTLMKMSYLVSEENKQLLRDARQRVSTVQ